MAMSVKMERFNLCLLCLHVLLAPTDTTTELSNVALHKPAHQHNGTRHVGPPGNVAGLSVDGIRLTSLDYCSHTWCPPAPSCGYDPRWWVVDLQGFYVIHAVVITNRGEGWGFRLSNFDLETYSENPVAVPSAQRNLCFHEQLSVGDGATVRFDCNQPSRGRYVMVHKRASHEALQLCEVEVLADLQGAQAAGKRFVKANDEKAAGDVITETIVGSALKCSSKCAKEPGCTAFDLGPKTAGGLKARACRLLIFGGLLQNTSFTITTSGWSFWALK